MQFVPDDLSRQQVTVINLQQKLIPYIAVGPKNGAGKKKSFLISAHIKQAPGPARILFDPSTSSGNARAGKEQK